MAVEKIVTLCKEGDSTTEYYPNIKGDNIPSKAISENKLDDNLQEKINRTYPDVYTKEETDALLDDKANADNVYTKEETDALLDDKANETNIPFENIKDKDAHNRFIEGNITTPTISGVTFNYAKWSLSGTHLMIVVAGEMSVAIASGVVRLDINLPNWILAKIYLVTSASAIVNINKAYVRIPNGTDENPSFELDKTTGKLVCENIEAFNNGGQNGGFRIQFDLLIDNE